MPKNQDSIDLFFNGAGDITIDGDRDVASTEHDILLSLKQEIRNRVKSDLSDWTVHPWIGAGLTEIVGEPNSKETAEIGKEKILNSLTTGAFVAAQDVNITYMPVSKDAIAYRIKISVEPTEENDYAEDIQLTLVLDLNNDNIVTVY